MSIIQAAVGGQLKEFDEHSDLTEVRAFVNQYMANAAVE